MKKTFLLLALNLSGLSHVVNKIRLINVKQL